MLVRAVYYLRFGLLLLCNLLLFPIYIILFLLGLLLSLLPIFPSKVGLKNFKSRLGVSGIKAHVFLAIIYLNYFIYLVESFGFWYLGLLKVVNEKEFAAFVSSMNNKYSNGKSCCYLMLGAHYGNIEILGYALTKVLKKYFSQEYAVLAQFPHNKIVAHLVNTYRKARDIRTINSSSRNLVEILKKHTETGISIALLIDQKPKIKGAFYRFLGEYAAFPHRGAEKLIEVGCPVFYLTAQRVFPGCFRLVFAEGENPHRSEYAPGQQKYGNSPVKLAEIHPFTREHVKDSVALPLSGFVGWLEELIIKNPLQWFWDYNKWSRATPKK